MADKVTLVPKGQEVEDPEMASFLEQVKQIPQDMASMSGADHIARLHRPGARYFNLNPFEVLGLSYKATPEEVKQAYRKMSIKVHPDKNAGNERAQAAFEMVKESANRLEDETRYAFCVKICEAAEEAVQKKVKSQKKKLRKEGEDDTVPEDDPDRMAMSVKVMISRMFAEFEQRKRQLEQREADQKKKAQEEQAEKEFMEALAAREQKLWEKSRQKRVQGWRSWTSSDASKAGPKRPKLKEEKREDGKGYNAYWDEKGEEYRKEWR